MNAPKLAGQEAWYIDKRDDRDLEAIAKAHKARSLAARVAIKDTGKDKRLIGNNANRAAFHTRKTRHNVLCEQVLDLEEIAFIDNFGDEFFDIIRLVRVIGDQRIKRRFSAIGRIAGWQFGHAR